MNLEFPVFKNTYILCPVKRPKSNDNQVIETTPSEQVMALNTTYKSKGNRASSRSGCAKSGRECTG